MHSLIALGANLSGPLGSPLQTLQRALDMMQARAITILRRSPWYATPAYPAGSGPDFVNAVVLGRSSLSAGDVLAVLHGIEADLGRVRHGRWQARACDLDLLDHGGQVLPDAATQARWMALDPARQATETPAGLILPHPRLHQRAFVLVPLASFLPHWIHPVLGDTAAQMRDALPMVDLAGVRPLHTQD